MVGGPSASVAEWSRRRSCLRCPRRPERPSHLPHPLAPARHAPSARARPLPIFLHPDWSLSLGRRRELLAPPERGEQRSPGREANETVSESSGRVPLPHRPRPARASFLPATPPCSPWAGRALRAPSPGLPIGVLQSSALSPGAGVAKPRSLDRAIGCDRAPVQRLAGLRLLGSSLGSRPGCSPGVCNQHGPALVQARRIQVQSLGFSWQEGLPGSEDRIAAWVLAGLQGFAVLKLDRQRSSVRCV